VVCDKCKNKTFVIFINKNHEKLCDHCYDKTKKKSDWELIQEKNEKYK